MTPAGQEANRRPAGYEPHGLISDCSVLNLLGFCWKLRNANWILNNTTEAQEASVGCSGSGGWTRTSDLRVMSFNLGEGASNRISSRLRVPSVVQYPRAQRG